MKIIKKIMKKVITLFYRKKNVSEGLIPNIESEIFEVNNWILSEFIVRKLYPVVGCIPFPLSELNLLAATVVRFRPDIIFEWGTNIGKSARIFYEICRYFNIPSQIHTIDLPDNVDHIEHPHNKRGLLIRKIKSIKMYQGDGLKKSISLYNECGQGKSVLFFLDGDHSYESVKCELNGIDCKIQNAVYLIHDTFFQTAESGYNIGPYRAVREFVEKKAGQYKCLSTDIGLPGMTLLYPVNFNLVYFRLKSHK